MNHQKNYFSLLLFLLLSFVVHSQDIDDIRAGARAAFLEGASTSENHYLQFFNNLHAEGYFLTEVDYPCFNPNDCDPTDPDDQDDILKYRFNGKHLKLLVELTKVRALILDGGAASFPVLAPQMTNLETKIISGLNWWYQNIPYYDHAANNEDGIPNVGWWWNEIGKQRELQMISVLFFDYLKDPANATNILLTTPGTSTPAAITPPVYPIPNSNCSTVIEIPDPVTDEITNLRDAISADFQIAIGDLDDDDNHTGANKADIAGAIIAKGLLENCTTYVNIGRENLECVMNFATDDNSTSPSQKHDGVREDFSFNQHNKKNADGVRRGFLYSGGYGMTFMHNVAVWGKAFTNDSTYDYLDEPGNRPKENFFRYILEGYRWMLIGEMTDYSANGRDIAKRYPSSNADITDEDMQLIVDMAAGSDYESSLQDMQMQLGGRQIIMDDDGNSLHHKHFWISDYVVHQEEEYFTSLRMCSDRTLGTEEWSGDNTRAYWLPYGCTFIYKDGDEYIRSAGDNDNIFPFWDWSYIPGVTSPVAADPDVDLVPVPNKSYDNDSGVDQANTQQEVFVGNASNDSYGVSVMSYDKDYYGGGNIVAKKAWFHFGEEVIALGAGINGGENLHTTINQCLQEEGTTPTIQRSGNAYWVNHDGIAYILPDGPMPGLYIGDQSGDWNDINNDCNNQEEDCSASGNVFRLWVDHGIPAVADPGSYYYIIAPGQDATNYTSWLSPLEITPLKNTEFIQAVKKVKPNGDVLAGVIYYPGSDGLLIADREIQVASNIKLYTDKPCALLYDGSIGQVCISSPDRNPNNPAIQLKIKETIGSGEVEYTEIFDDADLLEGKSQCMDLFSISRGNVVSHCQSWYSGYDGPILDVEIYDTDAENIYVPDPMNPTNANLGGYIAAGNLISKTNIDGNFSIAKRLPSSANYALTPFRNDNILNGVNTSDLALISNHLLGTGVFNSPYQLIASDVNGSNSITTIDLLTLQQVILGNRTYFPNHITSWRFVDTDYIFQFNPNAPLFPPFPESRTVNLGTTNTALDFTGIKIGDVTCHAFTRHWILPEIEVPVPEDPKNPKIKIIVKDKTVVQNEIVEVLFKVENFSQIEAYQLGIEFNSEVLEKQSISSGDLNRGADSENFGLTDVEEGIIKSVWLYNKAIDLNYTILDTTLVDSSSLFKVTFKAKMDFTRSSSSSYKLSDLISLNDDLLANRAYSEKGEHQIKLKFVDEGYFEKIAKLNTLLRPVKCFPNPTQAGVNFQLDLRKQANVQLQIFDSLGKLLNEEEMTLSSGVQTINMESIKDWSKGLYFYTITAGEDVETGKFVKQ